MRILIVSVTTGGGHNSSADAIANQFREMGINEVIVEDLYRYCNEFIYRKLDRGYIFTTKYLPKQFGSTYDRLDRGYRFRKFAAPFSAGNYIAKKFAKYFENYMPDIIITTHVLSAIVLQKLRLCGLVTVPIIGVVTDYCIHPYWEDCNHLDYIVTGSELMNQSAVKKGIEISKILPLGIPVKPSFAEITPKDEARRLLGLDRERRTILVMGGSMGYGRMSTVVREILDADPNWQIVTICGSNRKLYESLRRIKADNLRIEGYIDNVSLYMDAADCIVTKPGGLTTTEILVKALPAVIINPIPGPEVRNAEFLQNSGGAVRVSKYFSVTEALYFLFSNPDRLSIMQTSLRLAARPNAAESICKFTIEQLRKSVLT